MLKPFPYSGNKAKLLEYLPPIPTDTKRLVECYGGSMIWSLNNTLPAIVYEINPDLIAMYKWLRGLTSEDIKNLPNPKKKVDIRKFDWSIGQNTYYKLCVCSLVVGQLSSWTIYPQHNLPKEKTIAALPRLKEIKIISGNVHNLYEYQDGDFLFLDPPYINTQANYKKGEKNYHPIQTADFIDNKLPPNRWFMTYSSIPPEFKKYNHKELCRIKVSDTRNGGVVERIEYLFWSDKKNKSENPIFFG